MDQIENLNKLARQWVQEQVPMTTTEQMRQFFENPPKLAYSIPLEESRTSVIKAFQQGSDEDRRAILSKLNSHARDGFLDYAACMAVLAVRTKSPALIEQGLIALLIEGGGHLVRDERFNIACAE